MSKPIDESKKAIAQNAAIAIAKQKSGDYDKEGNRIKPYADGKPASRHKFKKWNEEVDLGEHEQLNRAERITAHKRLRHKHSSEGDQRLAKVYDRKVKKDLGESVNTDHYKAIADLELNTKNRNMTVKGDGYGPINPKDEKGSNPFWEAKAKMWNTTVEAAKQSTCGNCAAFNQSKDILDKIADGLGPKGDKISDLANLGFCEIWEFKCAADRTCNIWLLGGPLKESKMEISEASKELAKKYLDEKRGLWDNIHDKRDRIKKGSGEHMRRPGEKGRPSADAFKAAQEEYVAEGPKDAAGKDVFVKKIAKSAGVDYKAAGAIAAAAGRKRLGKAAFQRRVEAGQKAAASARSKGQKYDG